MYTHMHVYRRYLRKILLHVPQTPIINRASRSHARKVSKMRFQSNPKMQIFLELDKTLKSCSRLDGSLIFEV